jgi:hypothetical protein
MDRDGPTGVKPGLFSRAGEVVSRFATVEGDRRQTMKRPFLVPVMLLTLGLVALGIVAGTQQRGLDDLGGSTIALLMGASFFGLLLVFVSTWVLLSSVLPTLAYHPTSQREGLLGGILIAVPFGIGVLNACVGEAERSPLFVPVVLLNAVGVSAAFWFLVFCIGHLLAQDRPALFKGLWVVLLLLGNLVAMPLYWYIFVWPPHLALLPPGDMRREQP